jgi:hypothetical protein
MLSLAPKKPPSPTFDQLRDESRTLQEQAARLQEDARLRCEEIIHTIRAIMTNIGSRKTNSQS